MLLPLGSGVHSIGATALGGPSSCAGADSIPLPRMPTPPLFGVFLTVKAITLCPQGGLGVTPAIEFPIGS